MKTKIQPLRILFLSYESSHDEIFLNVVRELKKISDVWFKILDSGLLFNRPVSIRHSYKKELNYFIQIIDQVKPDVFVVANDQGISATFIRISKLRGIPSVAIQDGILANKKLTGFSLFVAWFSRFLGRVLSLITTVPALAALSVRLGRQWSVSGWGNGNATVIAATGDYYKRVLISRGVSPDRIVVTGYPLLDDSSKHRYEYVAKGTFFEEIGLSDRRPLILLITQPLVEDGLWEPDLRLLYFESVVNAVKHVNGQLIVKVHPREHMDVYELLANKYPDINIFVTQDFNLDQLLLSSDVIVTVSSTVGLWAMAYEKPLLVMNCFPLPVENVLASMARSVDELDKLHIILDQILSDERQKSSLIAKELDSLNDHLYLLDGRASTRIAKLIIAIANNCRRDSKHFKCLQK